MNVSLTPRNQNRIREWIERGIYPDADTVVGEALQLLEERERQRHWLNSEIQIGIDESNRGELIALTPEYKTAILERAIEGSRTERPIRKAVKP